MRQSQPWLQEATSDRAGGRSIGDAGTDLLVVSNRQPYRHEYGDDGITVDRPTGGLTAGLDAVMRGGDSTWIAWGDGDADAAVVDQKDRVTVPPSGGDGQYVLQRVWLSDEQVDGYYYGFANRVLWPLCHAALTEVDGGPGYWRHYEGVNDRFADAAAEAATDEDVVWFQDYHLALAPHLLRERGSDAFLAHTWHIPWPSWDVFRSCPHAREILRGLLATDLLTFHVQRHCESFLKCVAAGVPEARVDWSTRTVTAGAERTAVRAFPMGVPVEDIHREAQCQAADSFWREFAAEHGLGEGNRVAVSVDRLDYTKGIPQRIAALEQLWASRPRWRGALTAVQIGSESRSRIPAYRDYQTTVEEAVERVNERFGTEAWTPIVYTTDRLADEEIYALYRHADLGLVTPIRDGMNLVAQEYVAAQDEADGVLVLGEGAGAHDEIGEWTLSISPHGVDDLAATIEAALTMAPSERRARLTALQRYVTNHDIDSWVARVFDAIESLREPRVDGRHHARA